MTPEYRCLICDLVLADDGTAATRRCDQCGKLILQDQPIQLQTPATSDPNGFSGPGSQPNRGESVIPPPLPGLDQTPPRLPPLPTVDHEKPASGNDPVPAGLKSSPTDLSSLPIASPVRPRDIAPTPQTSIPIVRPVNSNAPSTSSTSTPTVFPPRMSEAGPRATTNLSSAPIFDPNSVPDPPRPKPKVALALLILFLMVLAGIGAVTVIGFAIAKGLKRAKGVNNTPTSTTLVPVETTVTTGPTKKPTNRQQPKVQLPPPVPSKDLEAVWAPAVCKFAVAAPTNATSQVWLPGKATSGIYAGNGRYLLFQIPELELIAVFDVGQLQVAKYLPAPANALFASTSDKVFIIQHSENTGMKIDRYDLKSFVLDKSTEFIGVRRKPVAAAAGHQSEGPLAILLEGDPQTESANLAIYETRELKKIDMRLEHELNIPVPQGVFKGGENSGKSTFLRCSASGKTLVGGIGQTSEYTVDQVIIRGNALQFRRIGRTNHIITPTAEGDLNTKDDGKITFPLSRGSGYFKVSPRQGVVNLIFNSEDIQQRVDITNVAGLNSSSESDDRWAFLIRDTELFIFLDSTRRSIRIHRAPIRSLLPKDYIGIASVPVESFAVRGRQWRYPLRIVHNSATTVSLIRGPEGMMIEDKEIVWVVPEDCDFTDVDVEVSVSSKLSPQLTTKQNFSLAIRDQKVNVESYKPKDIDKLVTQIVTDQSTRDINVVGIPNSTIQANIGTTHRQKIRIAAPTAKVQVTLEHGPPGMKWENDTLVWRIPENMAGKKVLVILSIDSNPAPVFIPLTFEIKH